MLRINRSVFASFFVTKEFCRESIERQNFFNLSALYAFVSYIAYMSIHSIKQALGNSKLVVARVMRVKLEILSGVRGFLIYGSLKYIVSIVDNLNIQEWQ